jgi:integrase/recombinase XerD
MADLLEREAIELSEQDHSLIVGGQPQRGFKDAGPPVRLSPHSFRVTVITDLLSQGGPLDDVQFLAGHSSPRTTKLYERRQKKVTRNIVERILI